MLPRVEIYILTYTRRQIVTSYDNSSPLRGRVATYNFDLTFLIVCFVLSYYNLTSPITRNIDTTLGNMYIHLRGDN